MNFRRYIIIDTQDADKVNYRDPYVTTTNASTARRSVDGTKTLISYHDHMPLSISAIESKSQEYTREEIEPILQTAEWYVEDVEV